jgi:hypothetical protein
LGAKKLPSLALHSSAFPRNATKERASIQARKRGDFTTAKTMDLNHVVKAVSIHMISRERLFNLSVKFKF